MASAMPKTESIAGDAAGAAATTTAAGGARLLAAIRLFQPPSLLDFTVGPVGPVGSVAVPPSATSSVTSTGL